MTQRRWCLGTAMPGTPRTHGPSPHGVGALPWVNDRTSAEASLPAEAAAFLPAHLCVREEQYGCGILLLYRHETWHRGTPLLPGALRVVVNLTFRKEGAEWVSQLPAGRSWAVYRRGMQMECLAWWRLPVWMRAACSASPRWGLLDVVRNRGRGKGALR